jgi:uncharacterized protein
MPREFLKRFMPTPHEIRSNRYLKIFGTILHEPNLWHMNRRSIAGAFAVGMFFMWMPVPMQMVFAAGGAILFRTNLPLSIALVWITNPVTIPPMFYFAYVVGTWVIGVPAMHFHFELSLHWLVNELSAIWKPFLTGCFLLAIISSITGYFTISNIWRYSVMKKRARRNGKKTV